MEIPRVSPITYLLDEVFYKSSIGHIRKNCLKNTKHVENWLLFSDYYFDNKKPNKVITFTAMPLFSDLVKLKALIKEKAPKDVKHTRDLNDDFIEIINSLPLLNIVFVFEQRKYLIWDSETDLEESILEYIEILKAYAKRWHNTEPERRTRICTVDKNLRCLERLVHEHKKMKLIASMYLISVLGGFVGSLLSRETSLQSLVWMSDRDSTNEICDNLIRDLFQITLIDITKKNIDFSFTSSNSNSDEWYEDLVRIPDYLCGAMASFDFKSMTSTQDKFTKMLQIHFAFNIENTFLYQFKSEGKYVKLKRCILFQ